MLGVIIWPFLFVSTRTTGWHYGTWCTTLELLLWYLWRDFTWNSLILQAKRCRKPIMANSFYVLETVNLIGERKFLGFWITPCGSCRGSKLKHQAEAPRLFSQGRRAHMGVFPCRWLGCKEWSLTEKQWGNGFGRNKVRCQPLSCNMHQTISSELANQVPDEDGSGWGLWIRC